jgi:hypothetical protein
MSRRPVRSGSATVVMALGRQRIRRTNLQRIDFDLLLVIGKSS